jgi:hypothetical protein
LQRKRCRQRLSQHNGKQIDIQLSVVILRHFPDFFENLDGMSDNRKTNYYQVRELVFTCISMFLLKRGSRNAMNNCRASSQFAKNYQRIFGLEMCHCDTVNKFLQKLEEQELEQLKRNMIQCILEKKILRKYLLDGKYVVAIDGTTVHAFDYEPFPNCMKMEHKGGKTTWLVNVVEAKIICSNGFCISLATQWQENDIDYDKQDCELKAFVRLAEKIKKQFPRLPICIVADGLYPNDTVFNVCNNYGWKFIITLKDGNLKSVQKEIDNCLFEKKFDAVRKQQWKTKNKCITDEILFVNDIVYKKHTIHYISCLETVVQLTTATQKENNFAHVTDIEITKENAAQISKFGRWRWKIENEGFNVQKNNDYNLSHKYSRSCFLSMKNYYQCLQIAHIINQLTEKSCNIQRFLKNKITIKFLWLCLIAFLLEGSIGANEIQQNINLNKHVKY